MQLMKLKVAGSEPQGRHILSVFCIFSKFATYSYSE
jgi:hypothetical protein